MPARWTRYHVPQYSGRQKIPTSPKAAMLAQKKPPLAKPSHQPAPRIGQHAVANAASCQYITPARPPRRVRSDCFVHRPHPQNPPNSMNGRQYNNKGAGIWGIGLWPHPLIFLIPVWSSGAWPIFPRRFQKPAAPPQSRLHLLRDVLAQMTSSSSSGTGVLIFPAAQHALSPVGDGLFEIKHIAPFSKRTKLNGPATLSWCLAIAGFTVFFERIVFPFRPVSLSPTAP